MGLNTEIITISWVVKKKSQFVGLVVKSKHFGGPLGKTSQVVGSLVKSLHFVWPLGKTSHFVGSLGKKSYLVKN